MEVEVADPAPQTARVARSCIVKDKANVDVMLGSAAPLRRDAFEDYYAAMLANSALGESTLSSRLGFKCATKRA